MILDVVAAAEPPKAGNMQEPLNPMKANMSYDDVVDHVHQILLPNLARHTEYCRRAFNLTVQASQTAFGEKHAKIPKSQEVCTELLARIGGDLHVSIYAATHGYFLQAMTVATSTYESAVTLASIGSNNDLAEAWIAHGQVETNFRPVFELTRLALQNSSLPWTPQEFYDQFYRTLCMYKHGNPIVQRHSATQPCDESHSCTAFVFFPTAMEGDTKAARMSLEMQLFLSGLALTSYINNHVPNEFRPELLADLNQIDSVTEELMGLTVAL